MADPIAPLAAPAGAHTQSPRTRRGWRNGWRRRASIAVAALACLLVGRSATAGVLLPWSPVKPGYDAHPFATGVVYVPRGVALAPGYAPERLDSAVRALEASHGLRFVRPVRVIVARSWRQFNRGALIGVGGEPRGVLAAALQTGDVVYMSPLVAEPGRHPGWALAHELSHALLYQQVSLRESFALRRVRWLLEGMAVSTGNPGDYFGPAAFRGVVRVHPEYLFLPTADPHLERMPADTAGPFMLAEYRFFVEELRARYGDARLQRLLAAVVARPDAPERAFAATFGMSLDRAGADFVARVRAGVTPPAAPTAAGRAR